MKKLMIIFTAIFSLYGNVIFGQGHFEILAMPVEVDRACIEELAQRNLPRVNHPNEWVFDYINNSHGGYVVHYKQTYYDIDVENGYADVVLKHNNQLNTVYSNRQEVYGTFTKTGLMSKKAALAVLSSELDSDEAIIKNVRLMLIKDRDWHVVYVCEVYDNFRAPLRTIKIDAINGGIDGKRYGKKSQSEDHKLIKSRHQPIGADDDVLQAQLQMACNPCAANAPHNGTAPGEIYPSYPLSPDPIEEKMCPYRALTIMGEVKREFARCSPLKYGMCNDLLPKTGSNPSNYSFSYTTEWESYSKVFVWHTIKDNFGEYNLLFDVNANANNGADWTGNVLNFGTAIGDQKVPMDEFWVFHGMHDYMIETSPNVGQISNGNGMYNGFKDYLAQSWLGKIPGDPICNYYGGLPSGVQYKTNYSQGCYNLTTPNINRQRLSSVLSLIHEAIGSLKTSRITNDLMANATFRGHLGDPENFTRDILHAARLIHQNNASNISAADLCTIKDVINTYFADCFTIEDNLTDYYIKDHVNDVGDEPYWLGQMWTSPDIRNKRPNGTFGNPTQGAVNTLYVTIRNRGCSDMAPSKDTKLSVYRTMAGSGTGWPSAWEEDPYGEILASNVDIVATNMGPIPAGGSIEIEIPWLAPNPDDFPGTGDKHHICFLARITDGTNVYLSSGNIFAETIDVGLNTNTANNIAWRNMSLVNEGGFLGPPREVTSIYVSNPIPNGDPVPPTNPDNSDPIDIICIMNLPPTNLGEPTKGIIDMENPFNDPGSVDINNTCEHVAPVRTITPYISDPDFFEKGEIWLNFKHENDEAWRGFSVQGIGYETGRDGWIKITSADFKLPNLNLIRGQRYILGMRYEESINFSPCSFSLVETWPDGRVIGGETYVILDDEHVSMKSNNESMFNVENRTQEENGLVVKPNPVKNMMDVYLEGKSGIKSLTIFDITGKKVLEMQGQESNQLQLNVESFENGVYQIKVVDMDGNVNIKKLVKN